MCAVRFTVLYLAGFPSSVPPQTGFDLTAVRPWIVVVLGLAGPVVAAWAALHAKKAAEAAAASAKAARASAEAAAGAVQVAAADLRFRQLTAMQKKVAYATGKIKKTLDYSQYLENWKLLDKVHQV